MTQMTVTEALARIQTNLKRIEKKRNFLDEYVTHPSNMIDPLGDSKAKITAEFQSIYSLLDQNIMLRKAINDSNAVTEVTVGDKTMTVAEWIIWKRDIIPVLGQTLKVVRDRISKDRERVYRYQDKDTDEKLVINLDVSWLYEQIETNQEQLDELDGQLSLSNATTYIEY